MIFGVIDREGDRIDSAIEAALTEHPKWASDVCVASGYSGSGFFAVSPLGAYRELTTTSGMPLVVIAEGRLDNRADILARLGSAAPAEDAGDVDLITALYQKFGNDCVQHLEGDFTFAIWNPERSELLCAVDPVGIKQIYVYDFGRYFVFCSQLRSILKLPFVDRSLDSVALAGLLASGYRAQETFYAKIDILPPAHTLRLARGQVTYARYWSPLPIEPVRYADEGDYFDALRAELQRAVKVRLAAGAGTGIELSGGLDSSAIACLAGEQFQTAGGKGHVFVNSSLEHEDPSSESYQLTFPYLADIYERYPNTLEEHRITEEGRSLIDEVDAGLAIHGCPMKTVIARHSVSACGLAKSQQLSTMLSGFGGDEFVSHRGPLFLRHCYENRHTRDLVREIFYSKNPSGVVPKTKYLMRYVAERLGGRRKFATGAGAAEMWRSGHDSICGLLSPEQQSVFRALRNERALPEPFDIRSWQAQALVAQNLRPVIAEQVAMAEAFGFEYRYPLLDQRVLSLTLGMPGRLAVRRGVDRYPFREALKGVLPDSIRTRPDKAGPSLPAVETMLKQDLDEMIARIDSAADTSIVQHYFDPKALRAFSQGIDLSSEEPEKRREKSSFVSLYLLTQFLVALSER